MWITESAERGRKMRDSFMLNGISVLVKDKVPEGVDLEFVLNYVAARVPFYLTKNVEMIYVGMFPEMVERDINAFMKTMPSTSQTNKMMRWT